MSDLLSQSDAQGIVSILAQVERPGQAAQFGTMPGVYRDALGPERLTALLPDGARLWSHQAASLLAIAAGDNLVLATGTASGKSLAYYLPIIAALEASHSTHLIFCPAKALAADQLKRLRDMCVRGGFDPQLVREINGDIPFAEREIALREAQVLLVTPDVINAWLMRQLANPDVQSFLKRLQFVVLDEAHALEGAFGSNMAYLLRRLLRAHKASKPLRPCQFIAASATIRAPADHLTALTGLPFIAITEQANGAPVAGTTIVHIDGPSHGSAAEAQVVSLLHALIPLIGPNAFIVFVDSRQGAERICRSVGRDDVLPYRSGYDAEDYRKILAALSAGRLKGVIATSSLELGIDIPQFVVGINVGLPPSRKALHQRIGRVGRNQPGTFLLMAPAMVFAQFGTSFEDYLAAPVESSALYLDNGFIHYAQARCLLEEGANAPDERLLEGAEWPASFVEHLPLARPGARRSKELDLLAMIAGDSPHLNFPLRQIGDQTLVLKLNGTAETIGTIALHQAIREAYPGATYFHLQKAHKVTEWRVNSYDRAIYLRPVKAGEPTRPLLRNWVNGSYAAEDLIAGRLLRCDAGAIAEARLQVLEAVEGYRLANATVSYAYLRQTNPRMCRKQREFSTTGIILQISESWFAGSRKEQVARRQDLGKALKELLCREDSISPQEIDIAASQVSLHNPGGVIKLDDAIAIYDNVHGGLRLSSRIFDLLPDFAERLCKAAHAAGEEALLDLESAERFRDWVSTLRPATAATAAAIPVPDGERLVFAPDSLVNFWKNGIQLERRLIAPQLMRLPDGEMLMYSTECEDGGKAWVAHDAVEPAGNDWARVLWNPDTDEMRPLPLTLPTLAGEAKALSAAGAALGEG